MFEEASATIKEEKRLVRDITRSTPGDPKISLETSPEQRAIARKRSQYYENVFAANPSPLSTARDRVLRESLIMAEIKTNVIIQDEFNFITDISYALSTRYQRPENSILVTVAHSCCVLFGGNFDPAYILNVTAHPSQVLPVTNKRNAALLGKSMEDALGVSAERGVIKFMAISEDNLASNGRTVAGEIEELNKLQQRGASSLVRSLSSRGTLRNRRRPSMKSLQGQKKINLPTHNEVISSRTTPPASRDCDLPSLQEQPSDVMVAGHGTNQVRKIGRRSFMASIFGRAG
ncbi:hypothetical protein K3495_g5999 [Podosphaera aphanis]|nr:hypothetical protein K3495_g5999 [Podosphaera aphanis]